MIHIVLSAGMKYRVGMAQILVKSGQPQANLDRAEMRSPVGSST